MFSRTLLLRQILSGLKRFPADKPCNIPYNRVNLNQENTRCPWKGGLYGQVFL